MSAHIDPYQEHPTVLIADDDESFRLLLRVALQQVGFRTLEAADGRRAVELFEAARPDLVLLDILMPEMDGYAACAALRAMPAGRGTPVVMLTSLEDGESIARAYDVGATDFLTKPINYLVLTQRLRYLLRANRYLACHDELTGLPNRARLLEHLRVILHTAGRRRQSVAVLFLGLDNFRRFNETLGHRVGDALLRQVAERLLGCTRAGELLAHEGRDPYAALDELSDTGALARFSGDEFALVLRQVSRLEDSALVARRLQESLASPFAVGEHQLHVAASIGVSVSPLDGNDPHSLLQQAELAANHAKSDGGNRVQFHTAELNVQAQRRFRVEHRLRSALSEGRFALHYQPVVSTAARQPTGVEALLRWHDEELGDVGPGEFIPLAEQTGLIAAIGEWVLETALRQLAQWRARGLPPLTLAVNVSPQQFRGRPLVQTITGLLAETGVPPAALELEVTEGLLIDDAESTLAALHELKRLGVRLAVDDFGTGYSSLNYLKRLPLDTLKIDRSLVSDLTPGSRDLSISRAIVQLAHGLGLRVIAEGVEKEPQLEALRNAGCDQVQGFLFAPALEAAQFEQWLTGHRVPACESGAGARLSDAQARA